MVTARPDDSATHQVTDDGGWSTPSMAEDGTIWAVSDDRTLVRLTQAGAVLRTIEPESLLAGGIYDLEVSEDGRLVAHSSIEVCSQPDGDIDSCRLHAIEAADGSGRVASVVQKHGLTFFPGTDTVVVSGLASFGPGDQMATDWFDRGLLDASDLEFSADGSVLALAGCDYGDVDDLGVSRLPQIEFHQFSGPPLAPATTPDCFIFSDEDVVAFDDVALAPDASAVAYTERPVEAEAETARLLVQTEISLEPCGAGELIEIAEGATDVGWSSAAFDPTGGPVDPGPGGPVDPGPGGPVDPGPGGPVDPGPGPVDPGEVEISRLDGGGAADPIGQAITTFAAIFEDGAADRVVLATADRFPDALAGAALAGVRGPIMLTPSTSLNADTAGFVRDHRITQAIILGGEAAVSSPVASQLGVPTRRVSGAERTETSAAMARDLWHAEGLTTGSVVVVNVRHEQGWQPALTAAVVSAALGAPQLGVENPPATITPAVLDAARTIGRTQIIGFGGTDLVSDDQLIGVAQ